MNGPLGTNRDPVDNAEFLLAVADRLVSEANDAEGWDHIKRLRFMSLREREYEDGARTTVPPEGWETP